VKIKVEGGPGQNSCADLPYWITEKSKELRALSFAAVNIKTPVLQK
jgi:hypothetical protein